MGRRRVPSVLINPALAVATTALVLLVIEGVARVSLRWRGGGKERDERTLYVDPDPRLGWRKRPGARVTYRRREYTVEVSINSHGLRDRERDYAKPAGTFRILALGDSYVEGYSVPYEQTVTQRLEGDLARGAGCRVDVLNGGTLAYSTDQEYLFYLDEGARYSPDLVLLFLYYNDIVSNTLVNYWGSPKPRLAVKDGELVLTNFPVPRPYEDPSEPGPPPSRVIHGSAAFKWAKDRLARGAPRAFNALASLGLWEPLGGDTIEADDQMRVYKHRRQPPVEAAWDLTDAILRAFTRETRARGARFLVVYAPARFEVSDRDWDLTRLQFDLDEQVWDRGLVARRLKDIGASGGFEVLDLTTALRDANRGVLGEPYFIYDGHWNALGHRTAARAVESYLRAGGWLPPCVKAPAPAVRGSSPPGS